MSRSGRRTSARRNSDRTSGSQGRSPNAAWKRAIWSRGSPLAVGRKRIRGTGLPASCRTSSSSAGSPGSAGEPPPPPPREVHHPLAAQGHVPAALARARGDDPVKLRADEVKRRAVVGRVARPHALADEAPVLLAARGPAALV